MIGTAAGYQPGDPALTLKREISAEAPGRIGRDESMYSRASRNSSFGESCSIARANRNSSPMK